MSHDQGHRYEWNTIPWRKLEVRVFKLQRRIYQATTRGETQKARKLQKLLAASWSAKSLAVRRVTQENAGKKTAGVDGVKSLTPPQRLKLISAMDLHEPAKPVRRIWIPKPGKLEERPLGIPIMQDRATQALVKLALEPEWEARFEPHSFGFRPGRSCQDAIEQIFDVISKQPRYVLDADIASCFDKINQAALLDKINTSPHFARPIKEWLKAGVVDSGIFMPTDEGTPQGGVVSPPTKLQTFFFGVRIARVRIDPKHNIDVIPGHFHSLDQRPDEVALARPVGGLQAAVEFGRKIFETANNQLQFPVQGRLIRQGLALLLQAGKALTQARNPGLKLLLVNQALRITVDQPGDALSHLAHLAFHRRQRRASGMRLRLQAAPIFLRQPLGMGHQCT